MELPLVSIIIPNYNRSDLIGETLSCLQAQSYGNWEALVIDDHSTDDSETVVHGFAAADKRIKWIKRNRGPKGGPTCRNIGVANAAGSYLIFLDSDDLLAHFCLEQRVGYMQQHPDLDYAVFIGQQFIKRMGDTEELINIPTGEDDLIRFLKQDSPWLISNPIWKTEIVRTHPWSEQLSCFQDYLFHVTALLRGFTYHYVTAPPDCFWRRGDYPAISNSNKSLERILSIRKVMDTIYDLLVSQSKDVVLKEHIQSSYVDVIHRALDSKNQVYAKTLLRELYNKRLFSGAQYYYLSTYISLYPLCPNSFAERALKKIFRNLIGPGIFHKQYGTFRRVKANDFFKRAVSIPGQTAL